jgi:hypothetical protein
MTFSHAERNSPHIVHVVQSLHGSEDPPPTTRIKPQRLTEPDPRIDDGGPIDLSLAAGSMLRHILAALPRGPVARSGAPQ